jgi:arginine exporter protein ArgO
VFAGQGLVSTSDYAAAGWIVLGVFLGSAAWWVILAGAAGRLRHRLGARVLRGINVVSGNSILGFAIWQAAALFR